MMRLASVIFVALVLVLGSTIAYAQMAPTCPAGCVPSSTPAQIGAGPVSDLVNMTGSDFDNEYMRRMYQLHSQIGTLATQGIQLTNDKNLKDLSGKIRYEQTRQSDKLAVWYTQFTGEKPLTIDYSRVQSDINNLRGYSGDAFDAQYAILMASYLGEARDASQLAMERSTIPQLRDQAGIVVKAANNEINALSRWLNTTSFETSQQVNQYCGINAASPVCR